MDKIVEDLISIKAEVLAKKHNIADVSRVNNVMKKIAIDCYGVRYEKDRNEQIPFQNGLAFFPSLHEALTYLKPNKALSLFETVDIDDLANRESYFDFLTKPETPFYTHNELAELIKQFIVYLQANKSSLLAIGYPEKSFERSHWLYENLSRIYPVKIPATIQNRDWLDQKVAERDRLAERDKEGNLIFHYTWAKECIYPSLELLKPLSTELTDCSYEESPLIQGITNEDVMYIEQYRSRVLNAKIEIMEIASKYLCEQIDKDSFWDAWFNVISKNITKDAFNCFQKLEEAYLRLFIVLEMPPFRVTCPSPMTTGQPNLETGGVNNILAFIFFIEAELNIGQMHKTKSALLKLTRGQIPGSYYELVLSRSIASIDRVIRQSLRDAAKTAEFNEFFNERLRTDSEKKLRMLLEVPSEKYNTVKRFADLADSLQGSQVIFITPSASSPNSKKITPISLPSGAKWEDITIQFVTHHDVKIKCKGKTFRRDYEDMGFENSKTRSPNNQWELLYILAKFHGEIFWGESSLGEKADIHKTEQEFGNETEEDNFTLENRGFSIIRYANIRKKTKQLLSQALKKVFQIDSDPFFPYKEVKAYKIRINLSM